MPLVPSALGGKPDMPAFNLPLRREEVLAPATECAAPGVTHCVLGDVFTTPTAAGRLMVAKQVC